MQTVLWPPMQYVLVIWCLAMHQLIRNCKLYACVRNTAWHLVPQRCCCTAQHSTAQHSTARHGTARHRTAQHSTAQQQHWQACMSKAGLWTGKHPLTSLPSLAFSTVAHNCISCKHCICLAVLSGNVAASYRFCSERHSNCGLGSDI